jgi:hypothetical protein
MKQVRHLKERTELTEMLKSVSPNKEITLKGWKTFKCGEVDPMKYKESFVLDLYYFLKDTPKPVKANASPCDVAKSCGVNIPQVKIKGIKDIWNWYLSNMDQKYMRANPTEVRYNLWRVQGLLIDMHNTLIRAANQKDGDFYTDHDGVFSSKGILAWIEWVWYLEDGNISFKTTGEDQEIGMEILTDYCMNKYSLDEEF